jgi:hypothetical protein
MDVLEYWRPTIGWAGFKRGTVSEPMWGYFCQLVQLCHAHEHWQKATQEIRFAPPRASVYGPESKYQRNKRNNEWKRDIERAEGHMHRAAYLAADKITSMSYLLTDDDEGKPDWNMYLALRFAIRHQPNHTQARCKVAAFRAFDADTELKGDPVEIARRWSLAAGYSDIAA